MYSFAMYLHKACPAFAGDDTACPEEFRQTKRMSTNFSATQKSRILIYQNNLCSSIQSVLSPAFGRDKLCAKMYF